MTLRSLLLLAGLLSVPFCSVASAGIVLTAVQTSLPTSNNVTVELYGTWDGNLTGGAIPDPGTNSALVGAYRFRLTIGGGTISSLAAQHNTAPTSAWSQVAKFNGVPASPSITGQQIEFRAANTSMISPVPIPNATIGTSLSAATLLGTIQFTAPLGTYTFTYTPLASDYGPITGFGYVNSNTLNDQFAHTFVAPPSSLSVIAVPEPSTLALCCLGGLAAVRFRRRAS